MIPLALRKVDLHVHTVFSSFRHLRILKARDSYNDPLKVYERCRAVGCDFVAITDHDTIDGAMDLLSRRPDLEPTVIVGEEIETHFPEDGQWAHVNALGIDEATHREIARLRGNIHELTGYLRSRGILHFLNHPLQSFRLQKRPMRYVEEVLSLFSHVEVGNGTLTMTQNTAAASMIEFGRIHGVPCVGVGGSDSHGMRHIGSFVTLAVGDDKLSWLASVAAGDCVVEGREVGLPGMLAQTYLLIGRYYGRLATHEGRNDMGAINYAAALGFVPICLTGWPFLLSLGNHLRALGLSEVVHRGLMQAAEGRPVPALLKEGLTGEPEG